MDQVLNHQAVELRLVIDIEPSRWSSSPVPQTCDHHESLELWSRYRAQCLVEADIDGLQPLRSTSRFYDAFQVLESSLILPLLQVWLSGSGLPGFPDEDGLEYMASLKCIDVIEGGYAVIHGDRVIEPDCCCGFSNLSNWEDVLRKQPEHGYVWTGHLGVDIKFEGDRVWLTQGSEDGHPPPEMLTKLSLSVAELNMAVNEANHKKLKLTELLRKRVIQLTGLHDDRELVDHVVGCLLGEA